MHTSSTSDCHHSDCHHHNVHHAHGNVEQRLADAKAHCLARGARFTPLREEVYSLILSAAKPMGAYDLISALQASRQMDGSDKRTNIAPPTVYRSLEFLLSEGLIHQLTSINAYVPCCHPRAHHTAAFLICEQCQRVQECSSLPVQEMMSFAEEDIGFTVARSVIELSGRCQACQ